MARRPDPKIMEVLKQFGFGNEALWDSHGTWVIYHRVLEQIAAKGKIKFRPPQILEANGKEKVAAILVFGEMGDHEEWSIGEAAPGNNKNAYPWAMAEKRAKDRVILKLIGLHGVAYSEEEADDFKQRVEEETDHRSPEAVLEDFKARALQIEFGNRKDFERAWKEELPDLSKIQRNFPELHATFMKELHVILRDRKLDHEGGSEDAPKTTGKQEPEAGGGDSPARIKAREMLIAWKASPHLTALETSMKSAGFLTVGEDGWVVKPASHLGAIREQEPEVFHKFSAEIDKLRIALSKGKAA